MDNLKKAEDLYLRGFCGKYIKRRTGISVQSLLKRLSSKGIVYTKHDIEAYQEAYIVGKYSADDVEQAYRMISKKYPDLDKASHGKHVECLGCGFGNYRRLFEKILGTERYKALRNECWQKKASGTVQKRYGVKNVFEKSVFSDFVSAERVAEGRAKREQTLIERYGVSSPNQNHEIMQRAMESMRTTNIERYGVENAMQSPDVSRRAARTRQQVMQEKYGYANSVQVPEIRDKILESRRRNGTLNASKPEDVLYLMLVDCFGEDAVLRNVVVDGRYPYHVDFYVKPLDLFIELNGDRSHNTHWFNPDDFRDRQTVASWTENMERIEAETGGKSRYRRYLHVWTETDVEKRARAKAAGLNYLVFWDGGNKRSVPTLVDAKAWFADGCPMPSQWHKENTY